MFIQSERCGHCLLIIYSLTVYLKMLSTTQNTLLKYILTVQVISKHMSIAKQTGGCTLLELL